MAKVWILQGDTYDGPSSLLVFSRKPSREEVLQFLKDHPDNSLKDDYTIRCHTWTHPGGWLPKVRNLEDYITDILNGVDADDGSSYGSSFWLAEHEVKGI